MSAKGLARRTLGSTLIVAAAFACLPTSSLGGEQIRGERCEYVAAGLPGPRGNFLFVEGIGPWLRRDGREIKLHADVYGGCEGPTPTIDNLDRIVVRDGEGTTIDQTGGSFAPGATPEPHGSEIEILVADDRLEMIGSPRRDSIRARSYGPHHIGIELDPGADGRAADDDVIVRGETPHSVRLWGRGGADTLDARGLVGFGDARLRHRLALYGQGGADLLLGSGDHERIWDGRGDDRIRGGGGGDEVFLAGGSDDVVGGIGTDWVIASTRGPDPVDRIDTGPGDDYVSDFDGRPDLIACGTGFDEVERDRADRRGDRIAADCERLR